MIVIYRKHRVWQKIAMLNSFAVLVIR